MFYLSVPIILQVLLIVHVVRNSRDRFWIYILIFVPIGGGLAYLIVEVLPGITKSPGARVAKSTATKLILPDKAVRDLEERAEFSPTVRNRSLLADEYANRGRLEEAAELYERCLSGPFTDDVTIISRLARVRLELGDPVETERLLARVEEIEAGKSNPGNDLLRARARESSGHADEALCFYRRAAETGSGLEYQYWYGNHLMKNGSTIEAYSLFKRMVETYRMMPKFARKTNREWIQRVESEMKPSI